MVSLDNGRLCNGEVSFHLWHEDGDPRCSVRLDVETKRQRTLVERTWPVFVNVFAERTNWWLLAAELFSQVQHLELMPDDEREAGDSESDSEKSALEAYTREGRLSE